MRTVQPLFFGFFLMLFGISLALFFSASSILFAQAKYEPSSGCYIGAFIQNDPMLQSQQYGDVDKFESWTREHATYLTYAGYGYEFPAQLAQYYKSKNTILQIGFEPNSGLDSVQDSEYLHRWARAAHASGAMIFLRWASEMNGGWVAWYGNPAKYVEKWKIVWKVMKEEAPNVAMVWTPNSPGDDPTPYYPGDQYVDWVGVDLYCVYYYENGTPERIGPQQKLQTIYTMYSSRKPIMISEWGVAHNTLRGDTTGIENYAAGYLDSLYAHVQQQFPHLKSITYFDYNSSGTTMVDWKLTNNPEVLAAYKKEVSGNYFLGAPDMNVPAVALDTIPNGGLINSPTIVTAQASASEPIDSIVFYADSIRLDVDTTAPFSFTVNPTTIPNGLHQLKAEAFAHNGYSNFDTRQMIIDNDSEYVNIIVDNTSPQFKFKGAWSLSLSTTPETYGTNYLYTSGGDGKSTAIWKPNISRAGTYNVYTWWDAEVNNAPNVHYTIYHNDDSANVYVNQQLNGGQWNLLGASYFRAGTYDSLVLGNDAASGKHVIADAARFEWAFSTTEVSVHREKIPHNFILYQNYPNPFNPSTIIRYGVPFGMVVTLKIYDILGREILTAVNRYHTPGSYAVHIDGSSLPSGVYLYRLSAGAETSTKTMLLLK